MTVQDKIPVTVLTGFLGAGKTSAIRHLLETANGKRLGLIINEFGDLDNLLSNYSEIKQNRRREIIKANIEC